MIKRVLLGCTGSIGVLNIPFLVVMLRRNYETDIQALMTPSAERFLTPYSLEVLTGKKVQTDMFEGHSSNHIAYIEQYPAYLIAPATANTISKIAGGIADDIVSLCACVCLGSSTQLIMAPAMNSAMWSNPVVQENVEKLKDKGVHFVDPSPGIEVLTFMESSTAMANTDTIIKKLLTVLRDHRNGAATKVRNKHGASAKITKSPVQIKSLSGAKQK